MMRLSRRQIVILAIALGAMILLTLLLAPMGSDRQSASTYSRAPDGYGAWYASMQQQGKDVKRWQQPTDALFQPNSKTDEADPTPNRKILLPKTPITFLRIGKDLELSAASEAWVKQGNVLVLVGAIVDASVTQAPFTSDMASPGGIVRIATSRRYRPSSDSAAILQDSFGTVVWQKTLGKGRLISVITTHLAANAYQDFRANYELLAKIVTEPGYPVWVDEYLHGYKDSEEQNNPASEANLFSYLMRTPLSLLAIQAIALLLLLIWGQNRRLGLPERIETPTLNNSEAYIQALAGVLHKAGGSEFVLETLGKAEQLEIQKALGLGTIPLSIDDLIAAWLQQTGQPTAPLQALLRTAARHRRVSETELSQWLATMNTVRSQLS
ncbi:DUF4350 domain-containing protein [Leptolyngbyaceae cyanobacterium UHCC 1019]